MESEAHDTASAYAAFDSDSEEQSSGLLAALRRVGAARSGPAEDADTPVVVPASNHSMAEMEEQLRRVSAVMEDDLIAIRRRIFAERKDPDSGALTDTLTIEEERQVYKELKTKHQVDLNDGKNLAELEDRGLMAHMEQARKDLAEQEKKRHALPDREDIRSRHVKAKMRFSSLVLALQEAGLALQCGVEDSFVQASNADKIATGRQPHAFPTIPEGRPANREAVAVLGKKVEGAAKACQATSTAITDAVNGIDVLRRESESIVDALMSLVAYYQASHTALEALLSKDLPAASDPHSGPAE